MKLTALMTDFIESPLRRLLFPYLEDDDDEFSTHWMSNITIQALGRDRPSVLSTYTANPNSVSSTSKTSVEVACQVEDLDTPWAYPYREPVSPICTDADAEASSSSKKHYRSSHHTTLTSRSQSHHEHDDATLPTASSLRKPLPRSRTYEEPRRQFNQPLRRLRQRSAPQPLKPAQPLPSVNTMLPLQLPPLELRAREQAAIPLVAHEPNKITTLRATSLDSKARSFVKASPTSSTHSPATSSESDGSFHGDPGDDDPESQLAAGIIALRNRQRQHRSPSPGHFHRRTSLGPRLDETENLDDTRIEEHCGVFASLADMLFEFDISGLRERLGRRRGSGRRNERSRSVDTLQQPHRRQLVRDNSTPSSLRAEVNTWSRARRQTLPRSRVPLPPIESSGMLPSASASPLLGSWPLASSLLKRSTSIQDLEDSMPTYDHEFHPSFTSTSESYDSRAHDDDSNDDPEEEDQEALSSLWASPTTSRSSSQYNLRLLSDEPSAFQPADEVAVAQLLAYERRMGQQRRPILGFTKLDGNTKSSTDGKLSAHAVSPLWDVAKSCDDDVRDELENSGLAGRENASRLPYVRSWTSFLNVGA